MTHLFPKRWDGPMFKNPRARKAKAQKPIKRTPIKSTKKTASRRRDEAKVIKVVRAADVIRDGYCRRRRDDSMHTCLGASEWCHLRPFTRAQTKRMAPEIRHQTAYTMMLCTETHFDYDHGALQIECLTDRGANGDVRFFRAIAQFLTR